MDSPHDVTAYTPEQMRALADRITNRNGVAVLDMDDAAKALRAAAGQLEAGEALIKTLNTTYDVDKMLRAIKAGE